MEHQTQPSDLVADLQQRIDELAVVATDLEFQARLGVIRARVAQARADDLMPAAEVLDLPARQ